MRLSGAEADGRLVLTLRGLGLTELGVQVSQVDVRLGSVGVDGLGHAVLVEYPVERDPGLRTRYLRSQGCESPGGLDPDGPCRVMEQRLQGEPPFRDGQLLRGSDGRPASSTSP